LKHDEESKVKIPLRAEGNMEADELEHGGPSLLLLAIIAGALFAGGLAATMTALMTSPLGVAGETMGALPEQAAAMRLSALLQLGGAIVLGIFTAAGVSRLRFLGLDMAPVQIAFFGGIAAAIFALLSALIQWVLTMPGITMDLGVIRLFQLLVLAVGGVGHVAAMGLLLAGISLAGGLAAPFARSGLPVPDCALRHVDLDDRDRRLPSEVPYGKRPGEARESGRAHSGSSAPKLT
jgi:hypothetical protein